MRKYLLAASVALLAGCGASDANTPAKTEVAAKLGAGLYEATAEVTALASTDKTTPHTKLKVGDKISTKACVGADGVPDPALLAEAVDSCKTQTSYARNGRMSIQLACNRPSDKGLVSLTVGGKFTGDSFDGDASTITQFYGDGDYRLDREISAKRVGDCSAETPKAG